MEPIQLREDDDALICQFRFEPEGTVVKVQIHEGTTIEQAREDRAIGLFMDLLALAQEDERLAELLTRKRPNGDVPFVVTHGAKQLWPPERPS